MPSGVEVEAPIATSWERCLQHYGIDPGVSKQVQVLTARELREYTQSIERFLSIAKAGARHLYGQVKHLGYATILTDAKGVSFDIQGIDPQVREWKRTGLSCLGAVWDEQYEGTNGIGVAIVEQRPVTVHHNEHFRYRYANLTCSAAPIIGPDGKTLGSMDLTALCSPESKDSQYLALQFVKQTARKIEIAYFLSQFEDQWVLKLSFEQGLAEVWGGDCFIALDGSGRVLRSDHVADRALSEEVDGSLVGHQIDEVFDVDFEKLQEKTAQSSLFLPIHTRITGRQMFVSLRCPQTIPLKPARQVGEIAHPKRRIPRQGEPLSLNYLAGEEPKLREAVERMKQVMNKPIPILLNGETGCGKEMFAKAIHNASCRADKPFVAVNCASIPESLIESELFGYKEGAFTGARSKGMRGKILQADGGTLFLDEIGDMPSSLQPRLLRVLAEREVTPLGGEAPIPVDLHVICATHRNILDMVTSGDFREDLYYRLNGISFKLPPLRHRSDVALLIDDVLTIEEEDQGGKVSIDEDAMQFLINYSWRGNIRQLRNAIRYALAVCHNNIITCVDLPPDMIEISAAEIPAQQAMPAMTEKIVTGLPASVADPVGDAVVPGLSAVEQAERQVIIQALQKNKWQVSKAVKEAGISKSSMYRKMKTYAIIPPNKR
jgi:transcriptional regulator of acetoin/glycerol metabolism